MTMLSSAFLSFDLDPAHSCWTLASLQDPGLFVAGVASGVSYRLRPGSGGRCLEQPAIGEGMALSGMEERAGGPHGDWRQILISTQEDPHGVSCVWTFALTDQHPFFLWKARVQNHSAMSVWIERISLLSPEEGARFSCGEGASAPAFYANGWQSWSTSGAYGAGDAARRSHLGPLQNPMVINPGTGEARGAGHFKADLFGVLGDRRSRRGLLAGFLAQKEQFGSLEAWLAPQPRLAMWADGDQVRLDPGMNLETDWAVLQFIDLDDPDPLDEYLRAVARENQIQALPAAPLGWCSWYRYYTQLSAADVESNLSAVTAQRADLPLDLVQIDDGFETFAGDWFDFKSGFPDGLAPLAHKTASAGLTPGLWLAPFILLPQSRTAREHPDWLLRGRWGRPANAGFVWNRLTNALDLTVPEALEYACKVVSTAAHEWGFPYLKLDFLYAGALAGRRHDPTLTRAQVLRRSLEAVREAVGPHTRLLGCGVPLGSALGLFDAVRIGPDVSGDWTPTYFNLRRIFLSEPGMPCARNSIQNILTRAALHQRWWINDPDCLLVRPDTGLGLAEVQTLASVIAMTGGSLLLSDDLAALPVERRRIAQALVPLLDRRARVLDWFDSLTPTRLRLDLSGAAGEPWHVLALFNWSDRPQKLPLDLADFALDTGREYLVSSFWDGECRLSRSGQTGAWQVAPHGTLLLAVRPAPLDGQAAYVGSDLHISQGLEVDQWSADTRQVRLHLCLPRRAEGNVRLALPFAPAAASLDGQPLAWTDLGQGIYCFPVQFEQSAWLEVRAGPGIG